MSRAMTTDPEPKVVSLSGQPVYHHDEPTPWQPPAEEVCLEAISDHIAAHLGPIASVFHELVSDTVHIDVHVVLPTADFPGIRLVTSGMSDLPMAVPADADVPRYLELMISLPGDWRLDQESLQDERWYWPIRLLKTLARLPHKHGTWLGWGHSMPNGDPPEPFASNTGFCGAVLLPPLSVPEAFFSLPIDAGKTIAFLAVVPLHAGEMDLKLSRGTDALTERFDRHGIGDLVDLHRRDVAKRRWWPFGGG